MTLEAVKSGEGKFDADAYHAMQERDEQLIHDQIVHGLTSNEFVYDFPMDGSTVTGVSVVGARELAFQYGGIKHRIIATLQKNGALFTARSFEPLAINCHKVEELADEDDFYEVIIEVTDVKKGNSVQVRKRESLQGTRKNGTKYDRPHYDVIAESKAYRNAVINILPQAVVEEFKKACIAKKYGNEGKPQRTLQDLRSGVLRFAMSKGEPVDRAKLEKLSYEEISDLASQLNDIDVFRNAAEQLNVLAQKEEQTEEAAISNADDLIIE
jgi:hypothetical protein